MLIDGGNAADSDLIFTYLKKYKITQLDYIVATHTHEDHVGGLAAPLHALTVGKVYAPQTQADTKAYINFITGVEKQGLSITVPKLGDKINFGSSEITFLAPITESYDDLNNTSIVLRIVYGETSFLFTGDAEREAEADIIAAGYTLQSNIIKIGHHGGETSTSYVFLREVMPEFAIISVGKDNSYGHPTEEVLSRLRDADVKLYRTDIQGDIIATSNGESVTFVTAKNQNVETNPTESETTQAPETTKEPETVKPSEHNYIGNVNTLKFHLPSCSYLPDKVNRIYFDDRQKAINAGYVPINI
ncbi:MAG: ComEC/Rec2 family competence protein [Eubacteriales bacterium]